MPVETPKEAPKPGYKTTEFWFSLLATLWGAFITSGVIGVDNSWVQVIGAVVTALAPASYAVSRGIAKQ